MVDYNIVGLASFLTQNSGQPFPSMLDEAHLASIVSRFLLAESLSFTHFLATSVPPPLLLTFVLLCWLPSIVRVDLCPEGPSGDVWLPLTVDAHLYEKSFMCACSTSTEGFVSTQASFSYVVPNSSEMASPVGNVEDSFSYNQHIAVLQLPGSVFQHSMLLKLEDKHYKSMISFSSLYIKLLTRRSHTEVKARMQHLICVLVSTLQKNGINSRAR